MKKLTLLTHNKGKLAEANEIAKRYGIELSMPQKLEKLEIQSDLLSDVSEFAARHAYRYIKKPLVVDDSGLFVKALGGFPGVYSAYAVPTLGDKGILKLMNGVKDRSAYFECSVSFFDGRSTKSFSGKVHGSITKREKGSHGFGFDPIFSPNGYKGKTLAEVDVAQKNKVSHRGKAFSAFFRWYSR
ncbi:MAG TPA: XTP/dITP diphosphatase [Candidatus Acidoferrum sp.]|nr:XTP/dITP diphosphatase [Candidatus Acidoferrum sp.]